MTGYDYMEETDGTIEDTKKEYDRDLWFYLVFANETCKVFVSMGENIYIIGKLYYVIEDIK